MPRFVIQTPGGKHLTIDAVDSATAMQGAQGWAAQNEGVGAAKKDLSPALPSWAVPFETFAKNATLGISDDIGPAMAAGATAIRNAATRATGGTPAYSAADRYAAEKAQESQQEAQLAAQHPIANAGLSVAGALATPGLGEAAGFIKGGAAAVDAARSVPVVGKALGAVAGGTGILARTGRSAAVMAAQGAVQGAANAPTVNDMAGGAASGGATGATIGTVLPGASALASKVVTPAANYAARLANAATGGRIIPAATTALKQTAADIDPDQVAANLAAWKGVSSPTLMDVGGENYLARLRNAASKVSPARQSAQAYVDSLTADLQPNAIAVAKRLAPDAPTAQAATDFATGTRQAQADAAYSAARGDPISLSSTGKTALQDSPGQDAINQAYINAAANRDDATMAELQLLRGGATSRPLSAGTVHALGQAMNELGTKAQNFGNNYAAKGYFSRAGDLMGDLTDQSPGYAQANSDFAANSRIIDAVPTGRDVLNAAKSPVEYASQTSGMSPTELAAAQVGGVQALTDAIGAPAENATGVLNKISSGTNTGLNLSALFGDDAASDARQGLSDEVSRVQNARTVSPNFGSPTQIRGSDAGHFGLGSIKTVLQNLSANTPAENDALFNMGTSDPSDVLAAIGARPQPIYINPYLSKLIDASTAGSQPQQQSAGN